MDKITTLAQTVDLMLSDDYKERFIAEFAQVKIRLLKLERLLRDYKSGSLGFEPDCPIQALYTQLAYMSSYAETLRSRAKIEDIELPIIEIEEV